MVSFLIWLIWSETYRIATGRKKQAVQITMLKKQDGSLTTNLTDTLHMLQNFTPDDNPNDYIELQ